MILKNAIIPLIISLINKYILFIGSIINNIWYLESDFVLQGVELIISTRFVTIC